MLTTSHSWVDCWETSLTAWARACTWIAWAAGMIQMANRYLVWDTFTSCTSTWAPPSFRVWTGSLYTPLSVRPRSSREIMDSSLVVALYQRSWGSRARSTIKHLFRCSVTSMLRLARNLKLYHLMLQSSIKCSPSRWPTFPNNLFLKSSILGSCSCWEN